MKAAGTRTIQEILDGGAEGEVCRVSAWVRTKRSSGKIIFIELTDGSSVSPLQVVAELQTIGDVCTVISTGSSVCVEGRLCASPKAGQRVELQAEHVEVLGSCPEDYPLQKKRHGFEFLRSIPHLRVRTNSFAAVARVRHTLAQEVHKYFSSKHFYYIHTPLITGIDAEGAGTVFTVNTQDSESFFGVPTYLTVSGQLHAECYAQGLGKVYTFAPTFRAENSNTSRHLSEFWMVEPEICFCTLEELATLADNMIRSVICAVLDANDADIHFFDRWIESGLRTRLETVVKNSARHITYDKAVELLQASGKKFEYPPVWGNDLQTEHERYICEEWCKGPVIVYNYPRKIKPFYMRQNDDGRTVAAMDMLVPVFGEILGGSQREERIDVLTAAMKEKNICSEHYRWYMELRRYGTAIHSGFGMGFDRLVQYVTGMQNIRDTIPFPRSPGNVLC